MARLYRFACFQDILTNLIYTGWKTYERRNNVFHMYVLELASSLTHTCE